ncbi:hypothetical protein MSAN_00551800 [Mycena sanguinolenta]|uniref:Uncharacterized protein n=1 Tax=Mycena sanguinolenta TaxID=230812 RepID=A0A8H7DHJ3_9AGAR|nr:hypothetical protein MSAN_00551800 [Mycena sanguinolenta]
MFPPELVELIIDYGWGCLSTSSHQHGLSMTHWMLVSHDWLNIVLSIVFRDLWITSEAHFQYVLRICNSNTSFVCGLAGITDIRQHLIRTCRSLIISAYHKFQSHYNDQRTKLVEYATESPRTIDLWGVRCFELHRYALHSQSIATFISIYTPAITTLHFVLIDCTPAYRAWNTAKPPLDPHAICEYPDSLVDLHVTFAYTSPPPAVLMDAPRGTFFPPPSDLDLPRWCRFDGVRRLVVRDANADFVAFLTTVCPQLKRIESTTEFSREDVPEKVPATIRNRLVFVRIPRTVDWGLTGSTDALPLRKRDPAVERPAPAPSAHQDLPPPAPTATRKREASIWHWRFLERVKHVFWERK